MKQILQNLKTGATELVDVPAPLCQAGQVLIRTRCSLISAGTERMLVEFSQANLVAKARSQPDKVRQALDKVRTDGLLPTLGAAFARLDQPLAMGYCNAGVVLESGVPGFSPGDRIASNGPHAEIVCIPQNLCAHIPDNVDDESAAFTPLASVALQGVRLAAPTIGEKVAVIGLGLLGQITVQILLANGCEVLGTDFDKQRLSLAGGFGAQTYDLSSGENLTEAARAFSNDRGVDAVIITAATSSNDPIHQAAVISRKRGRIVLVGSTGLALSRADFYEKELTFQVSCSYGPGRYDDNYENRGHDYPLGLVRWTEQRNFEAVLSLVSKQQLVLSPLISRRMPHSEAHEAYRELTREASVLGIMLSYAKDDSDRNRVVEYNRVAHSPGKRERVCVGVVGAGNFASQVLLPAIRATGARLKTVAGGNDATAAVAARKFGFEKATSDYETLLKDSDINVVFVATRHDTHARIASAALRAGKNVFVEKPLALNRDELRDVQEALQQASGLQLMVGYNRRFSPLGMKMKELLAQRCGPLCAVYTVNAGFIMKNHWVHDLSVGGGRIIGEACHFIDFLSFLTNSAMVRVESNMMGTTGPGDVQDTMSITIEFADGSLGVVHYFANGNKRFPKERVEAFYDGRVLVLDNFRVLRGYGCKGFTRMKLWRQDKGHEKEVIAFIQNVTNAGEPLISWPVLQQVSLATFDAVSKRMKPMSHVQKI